ncbi:UNVERIFIED_CONTAM: hypothetical protein K2H54_042192 [Gekko kuhli]
MEEKVAEMKNSLNCFKEELNDAKSMIEEISTKQEEMQQKIEQLQQEKKKESRKLKAKRIQKEEHGSQTVPTPLQGSPFRSLNLPEPVLINEDFVNLLHNATYEKEVEMAYLILNCRVKRDMSINGDGYILLDDDLFCIKMFFGVFLIATASVDSVQWRQWGFYMAGFLHFPCAMSLQKPCN